MCRWSHTLPAGMSDEYTVARSTVTTVLSQPSVSPPHPQIQMKDFRFSYKFKMACKEDVLKLCPNIKKK